jgi:hypothetical protein
MDYSRKLWIFCPIQVLDRSCVIEAERLPHLFIARLGGNEGTLIAQGPMFHAGEEGDKFLLQSFTLA